MALKYQLLLLDLCQRSLALLPLQLSAAYGASTDSWAAWLDLKKSESSTAFKNRVWKLNATCASVSREQEEWQRSKRTWCVERIRRRKRGRKYSRTSPLLAYAWARSLGWVRDRILRSPCRKVGKVLLSPGVPALLPHCLWTFLTSELSVPGCCAGVSG